MQNQMCIIMSTSQLKQLSGHNYGQRSQELKGEPLKALFGIMQTC